MERFCHTCFVSKPLEEFYKDPSGQDGYKVTCKSCISTIRKARRRGQHPISSIAKLHTTTRSIEYVKYHYKRFEETKRLNIPVRVINHTRNITDGCIVKSIQGTDYMYIATPQGRLEFFFELVSPQRLLQILHDHEMQVVLPKGENLDG